MSKKVTVYIVALVVLAVTVTGGIMYAVHQHNKPLTQEQFAQLPIEEQFKKAPGGHYVHLIKNDPTLYRTTWSKDKLTQYLLYTSGSVKTNSDGTSNEKTKLGTNHLFDDSKLVDSNKGYGEIGNIYFAQQLNSKFTDNIEYDPKITFEWYFDDLNSAKKDTDVSTSVNQIVR